MFWIGQGILAGLIGVYSIVVFIVNRRVLAARSHAFASRAQGDLSGWYCENFADAGLDEQECVRVLAPVAKAIGCEVTRLRPDDAFLGNLRIRGKRWLGLDGGDPLEDYLEYELCLVVGDTKADAVLMRAEHLRTLHDFVRAIGEASRP